MTANLAGRVVVTQPVTSIVRVTQGSRTAVVQLASQLAVSVVTIGTQGPVGTVAENVLLRALQAEHAANQAVAVSEDTLQGLTTLISEFKSSLDFHTGALSAIQE